MVTAIPHAAAPHFHQVHQLIDRLGPAQVEALYVLLRGMVGSDVEEVKTKISEKHRFSFIGKMDAEPDLAERSAEILRNELGRGPDTQ